MADPTALQVLLSIEGILKELVKLASNRGSDPMKPVDLDGKYGDPVIKSKDPRDWAGPSMIGRKFSECPAEYLDLLADRYVYFAQKNDADGEKTDKGVPKSKYALADAARARGWAARIRSGAHVPPADEPADERW